jgi:hypothetical protein
VLNRTTLASVGLELNDAKLALADAFADAGPADLLPLVTDAEGDEVGPVL